MSAAGDEAELVQPAAHGRSVVAVQLEELDTLIAQRGNGAQRSLEIAGAVLAHGVEHQSDTRHATSNPIAVPGRNRGTSKSLPHEGRQPLLHFRCDPARRVGCTNVTFW